MFQKEMRSNKSSSRSSSPEDKRSVTADDNDNAADAGEASYTHAASSAAAAALSLNDHRRQQQQHHHHHDHSAELSSSFSFDSYCSHDEEVDASAAMLTMVNNMATSPPSSTDLLTSKMPRSSNIERSNSIIKTFSTNRLRFSNVGLYGRSDEIATLKKAYYSNSNNEDQQQQQHEEENEEVVSASSKKNSQPQPQQQQQRQLVLIMGVAGSGKSALARSFEKTVVDKDDAEGSLFFVSGKFDQRQTAEPYAGIAIACQWLCHKLLVHDESKAICTKLQTELGSDEIRILVRVIPNLVDLLLVGSSSSKSSSPLLLRHDDVDDDESETGNVGLFEARNLLNFAFRRFLRVVSSFGRLVLTLDDLQWSDAPSMALFETLITDRENPSLMIIGCYRSDEVDDEHILTKTIRRIEKDENDDTTVNSNNGDISVTRIEVGNLHVSQVNQMIADLMLEDESYTKDLANIVHKKTLGNAFFVLQFLRSLTDQGLLSYSIGNTKWTWDIDKIRLETSATDNVAGLVQKKLHGLPKLVSCLLPLMACLGSSFSHHIFELVAKHFNSSGGGGKEANADEDNPNNKEEEVDTTSTDLPQQPSPSDLLEIWQDEGLVEVYSQEEHCRWVHDKIQEAAFSLVPQDELTSLKYRLGELLLERLTSKELQSVLFVTANLLHETIELMEPDELKRLKIAELNLRAGVKAIKSSGFGAAALYLERGIDLLPQEDRWQKHYALSLELFSTACEAEFCIGNFDQMQKYCDEILTQTTDRPLLDRRRAYNALIGSMGGRDRMLDAEQLCRDVLALLGCHFPKYGTMFCVLAGIVRLKITLKNRTPKQISKLATMTDESKIWAMEILDHMATYTYISNSDLLPLVILKGLRWTIRYGVSEFAPPNFALVALLTSSLGDPKAAKVYADQALALLKQVPSRRGESRVLFLTHWFSLWWTQPAHTCLKPLLAGYKVGMETGDTESAMWSIFAYLTILLHEGRYLGSLAADFIVYADQMREVKQTKQLQCTLATMQLVLNLSDPLFSMKRLSGKAIEEAEEIQQTGFDGSLSQRLIAAFYFEDYEYYVNFLEENGVDFIEKSLPAGYPLCPYVFYAALACLSMARISKRKLYLKWAKRFAKMVKTWAEQGNPNMTHYESLVDAEMAAFQGKRPVAVKNYEVAILLSGRRGHINDQALSHLRFGEYQLTEGNKTEAKYHFDLSLSLYQEWGAEAIVQLLTRKHGSLLSHPAEIIVPLEN